MSLVAVNTIGLCKCKVVVSLPKSYLNLSELISHTPIMVSLIHYGFSSSFEHIRLSSP